MVFVFLKTTVTMSANTETVVQDAGALGTGGPRKGLNKRVVLMQFGGIFWTIKTSKERKVGKLKWRSTRHLRLPRNT